MKLIANTNALIIPVVLSIAALPGCLTPPPQKTAAEHAGELSSAQDQKMTLGLVQSSIREGMPQSEVATALGSPNIVTSDADGTEVWIYDKIATETLESRSQRSQRTSIGAGVGAGVLGALVGVGGTQSVGGSDSTGATSQTQRTLTVVIKFDEQRLVKSIRYQSSSF
ncbi:MAG: hypothetical protein OXQ89_19560 [Rhodospirillaceae bacterium]|nr:hypothetical protein [Rhodospirillaceae bacterium]